MSDTMSDTTTAPRRRGRPTIMVQAMAEELAFRTYILRLEPPTSYHLVMQREPSEISKVRRASLCYVPLVRAVATAMVENGLVRPSFFHEPTNQQDKTDG
jgi:hypothetical protein